MSPCCLSPGHNSTQLSSCLSKSRDTTTNLLFYCSKLNYCPDVNFQNTLPPPPPPPRMISLANPGQSERKISSTITLNESTNVNVVTYSYPLILSTSSSETNLIVGSLVSSSSSNVCSSASSTGYSLRIGLLMTADFCPSFDTRTTADLV